MKDLPRIIETYYEEDDFLALRESQEGTAVGRRRWRRRRGIHDQAYFVMIFAQFESLLNRRSEGLVRRKRRLGRWQQRRAWELIDPGRIERLPFRSRLALLTERGQADCNLISDYYDIRCKLAHGELPSLPASIPTVVSDLQGVAKRLHGR